MARKHEEPTSLYQLFEEDPTLPKPDARIGPPPAEPVDPGPFPDLSMVEKLPEDVRAIVDAMGDRKLFRPRLPRDPLPQI